MLTERGGVLDLVFLGEREEFDRRLVFQVRKLDFLGTLVGRHFEGRGDIVRGNICGDEICHERVRLMMAGAAEFGI